MGVMQRWTACPAQLDDQADVDFLSQAQQRDRTGVFASSDATPAESSQGGEESAGVVDAEAAEDEENSSKQSGRFSERAVASYPQQASKAHQLRPLSCSVWMSCSHASPIEQEQRKMLRESWDFSGLSSVCHPRIQVAIVVSHTLRGTS